MAIPSRVEDLSTNTASNSPLGTDSVGSPGTVDDFFRSIEAIIRDESLLKSWERRGYATTYISASTFSVPTDQTLFFAQNRRVKALGATTIYGAVVSSSYNGAITTVTLLADSGTLDVSLSAVQLGVDPLAIALILTGAFYPITGGELKGNMSLSNRSIAQTKLLTFFAEYDNGNSGAGPFTIDWSNGQNQKVGVNANTTLAVLSASAVGHYQLRLVQDATGSRTTAFTGIGSSAWINNASQPAFNTAANGQTVLTFFWTGTAFIVGMQKVGTA